MTSLGRLLSPSTSYLASRSQPQLQGAASRMEEEILDVDEHFDDSTEVHIGIDFMFSLHSLN